MTYSGVQNGGYGGQTGYSTGQTGTYSGSGIQQQSYVSGGSSHKQAS